MNYTKCWLEYPRIMSMAGRTLTVSNGVEGPVGGRAVEELAMGLGALYEAVISSHAGDGADITLALDGALPAGGYQINAKDGRCAISGGDGAGALYGVFALLRELQIAGVSWDEFALEQQKAPSNDLRMLNHWDNLPGDIERGYSGKSFFFRDNEVLDTDLRCRERGCTVAELIAGPGQGMAAVANTGNDENWTGHDLAAANLYGFGRLSYDVSLGAEEIAREWLRQTFGRQAQVERTLLDILMRSWPAYEKYTAPLGIGWMVNPGHHYGPNVDGYEYDRWGTYHRADCKGIGVDRTEKGTNFVNQYAPALAAVYGSVESCPEELVLFFHHLPYDHVLKSGKTVLQHIYDTHFEGAEEAARFLEQVEGLKDFLKPEVYDRMTARFRHQKQHAGDWRDVINTYFYRKTGIPDSRGRTIYP